MLGALVPLLLAINGRLQSLGERVAHVEGGMQSLDARAARIETATLAHEERVARIEGAMTGPWRPQPANGNPPPRLRWRPARSRRRDHRVPPL